MSQLWAAGAIAAALAHLALIAWLVVGGPVAACRPSLARWHLAAVVPTGAVFLAGADCPLTVWEKACREAAGWAVYEGGFLEHYVVRVRPVHHGGMSPAVQVAIVVAWVLPTLAGHGWLLARGRWPRRALTASA
jgi:hypothetical protein